MKLLILTLATTVSALAQVPQAPPPVPTPRAQPFPPAGPGAVNNPAAVTPPGAVGRTFEQPVVAGQDPALNAPSQVPGITTPSVGGAPVTPGLTNTNFFNRTRILGFPGSFNPAAAGTFPPATGPSFVGTNFPPGTPNTFGFVATNFPPRRALDTNAPLVGTTITNEFGGGVGAPVFLGPTATPTDTPVGAPGVVEQGTGAESVFDFPPGTTVRRGVPAPPTPATPVTPAPAPIRPPQNPGGPNIPR